MRKKLGPYTELLPSLTVDRGNAEELDAALVARRRASFRNTTVLGLAVRKKRPSLLRWAERTASLDQRGRTCLGSHTSPRVCPRMSSLVWALLLVPSLRLPSKVNFGEIDEWTDKRIWVERCAEQVEIVRVLPGASARVTA